MASYTKTGVDVESLKGTKTEQNLHTALSAESQAYLRYKWFEKKAKTDGFVEISQLFRDTAANEMEHAEIWFKQLGGYSSTERNLDAASAAELIDLLLETRRELGQTLVMVTHDLTIAARADRVFKMEAGRLRLWNNRLDGVLPGYKGGEDE